MLRINLIIFGVGSDESNVHNPINVIDVDDQSEFIAADVENNSIPFQKARKPIPAFDVLRVFPACL